MTDLDKLRGLLAEATPVPWKVCGSIYEHMNCEIRSGVKGQGQPIAQVWDGPNAFRDAQTIEAAVNALPELLDRIVALEGERDALLGALEGGISAIDKAAQACPYKGGNSPPSRDDCPKCGVGRTEACKPEARAVYALEAIARQALNTGKEAQ